MTKRCASCGQLNPEAALLCEFCKAVFGKPKKPVAIAPVLVVNEGWKTTSVLFIAVLSAAAGFALRQFLPREESKPTTSPAVVVAPPPVAAKPVVLLPPPPVVVLEAPKPPPPVVVVATPEPAPAPPVEPPEPAVELKHFKVPYKAYEGNAQRIIVNVTFNGRVTAPMLVDTGAPGIVISFPLAAKIGVLREGDAHLVTMAGGIGGQQTAALVVLDELSVGEAKTQFVPATVTNSISRAFEGLVGMDFIGGYEIQIDTREHVLALHEQPKTAAMPAGHDEQWWRRNFALFSGQRTTWKNVFALAQERASTSEVSAGGNAEDLHKLVTFAEAQNQQAELLAGRLERYAAESAVPLEWRR